MAKKAIVEKEPLPVEDVIQVPRADMDSFMERLNNLEADNKRLLKAADVARMANIRAMENENAPIIRTVKLSRLQKNGPLILAWKMIANESYMKDKRAYENQVIEVFLEDGKSKEMPLVEFYRQQNRETVAEIISRSKNEATGDEALEVMLKDGKTLKISLAFVN